MVGFRAGRRMPGEHGTLADQGCDGKSHLRGILARPETRPVMVPPFTRLPHIGRDQHTLPARSSAAEGRITC